MILLPFGAFCAVCTFYTILGIKFMLVKVKINSKMNDECSWVFKNGLIHIGMMQYDGLKYAKQTNYGYFDSKHCSRCEV